MQAMMLWQGLLTQAASGFEPSREFALLPKTAVLWVSYRFLGARTAMPGALHFIITCLREISP
jgi:hypothetical protein